MLTIIGELKNNQINKNNVQKSIIIMDIKCTDSEFKRKLPKILHAEKK